MATQTRVGIYPMGLDEVLSLCDRDREFKRYMADALVKACTSGKIDKEVVLRFETGSMTVQNFARDTSSMHAAEILRTQGPKAIAFLSTRRNTVDALRALASKRDAKVVKEKWTRKGEWDF